MRRACPNSYAMTAMCDSSVGCGADCLSEACRLSRQTTWPTGCGTSILLLRQLTARYGMSQPYTAASCTCPSESWRSSTRGARRLVQACLHATLHAAHVLSQLCQLLGSPALRGGLLCCLLLLSFALQKNVASLASTGQLCSIRVRFTRPAWPCRSGGGVWGSATPRLLL